jgi:hypothetical protein
MAYEGRSSLTSRGRCPPSAWSREFASPWQWRPRGGPQPLSPPRLNRPSAHKGASVPGNGRRGVGAEAWHCCACQCGRTAPLPRAGRCTASHNRGPASPAPRPGGQARSARAAPNGFGPGRWAANRRGDVYGLCSLRRCPNSLPWSERRGRAVPGRRPRRGRPARAARAEALGPAPRDMRRRRGLRGGPVGVPAGSLAVRGNVLLRGAPVRFDGDLSQDIRGQEGSPASAPIFSSPHPWPRPSAGPADPLLNKRCVIRIYVGFVSWGVYAPSLHFNEKARVERGTHPIGQ